MKNYLRKTFALSDTGAKDLIKARVISCLLDIVLMLPIMAIFYVLNELVKPLLNGSAHVNLGMYLIGCALIILLLLLGNYLQYNATYVASYKESENKRISLAEKLRILPLSFFEKKDLSDLTTTMLSDCATMEQSFSHYIPQLFGTMVSTVLVCIGMLCYQPQMALSLIWAIPVSYLLLFLSKHFIDKLNRKNKLMQMDYVNDIQECIETIRDMKAFHLCEAYTAKLDQKFQRYEKSIIGSELRNGILVTGAQMVLKVSLGTTVLMGLSMLSDGSIDLLMFLAFLIAATRIFDPLAASLINLSAIFSTMLSVERMKEIDEKRTQTGRDHAEYQNYDIVFDHVDFSYDTSEQVLHDVSFIAKQGEITALIGPSGGGKSTIAKLAARFYDITKGEIRLGKEKISQIDPETLMAQYSIVFQDVILFHNTIMENIRIGKKSATDEEVIAAAKEAQCDEFISNLSDGYQTIIGENGSTLSGGERQRISIARALLKDAPVILLDEATASLDVENETMIQQAITNLVKHKTVLVIAHRMRTIANADHLIVLSDGHVVQDGKPSELLKEEGMYRHMTEIQRQSMDWKL